MALQSDIPKGLFTTSVLWLGTENTLSLSSGGKAGFAEFAILSNGTYMTTFKWRLSGSLQGDNGLIQYKVSTDKGVTWSEDRFLFGDDYVHNYDQAAIIEMPNRVIWSISSKTTGGHQGLVYKTTTDYTLASTTWSAEAEFPNVMPAGYYQYAIGNHYTQIGNRIIQPIYARDTADTKFFAVILY